MKVTGSFFFVFLFFFRVRGCLSRLLARKIFRLNSKGNIACNNKRRKSQEGKPWLLELNSCCNSLMWLFGRKTISWLTSFVESWWLDIGSVFITFFPGVKNVKTTTPGDFNLLTTLIGSADIFYINQIARVLSDLLRFLDTSQPFLLCLF